MRQCATSTSARTRAHPALATNTSSPASTHAPGVTTSLSSTAASSAPTVLDGMAHPSAPAWNCMIRGYSSRGAPADALATFRTMLRRGVAPDSYTMAAVVSASAALSGSVIGDAVHAMVLKIGCSGDLFVMSGLVNLYGTARSVEDARKVFEEMHERDVVSWTSMISAFAQCGMWKDALTLLSEMKEDGTNPNKVTIISLLSACAQGRAVDKGRWVYDQIGEYGIEADVDVRNALISMYVKCRCMSDALEAFRVMPERNTKSWNTLIDGFVQNQKHKEALGMFEQMLSNCVTPDAVTLVSVLSACAQLGALDKGRMLHSYVQEKNVRKDVCLESALVDMYAKCGCVDMAAEIFTKMQHKQALTWNSMIGGLASNGYGKEVIQLFEQMLKLGDPKPDGITFKTVLGACAHVGMVNEGLQYFYLMSNFGITPDVEHYGCIVDLLGRAGLLDEAFDFIKKMPMEANHVIWGSLLSACRFHNKMDLGRRIGQHIINLAPNDVGAHVLISNLHAEDGQWDNVQKVRGRMGRRGIEKSPGHSSIQV
ncbi:hypothetical protein PR202_gb05375 [Eleusine coracana subsp. coracana]|uniref:Pentatricopeptide repeat-containing protein n=1 Tax=Eleusine coracana subsp. coracana TaxID=191504 RepID=A0AAV5E7Q5_ELECO|nr:hypothetical protein PR202_gb05375 [Eleusine coracana subsp. coracana]